MELKTMYEIEEIIEMYAEMAVKLGWEMELKDNEKAISEDTTNGELVELWNTFDNIKHALGNMLERLDEIIDIVGGVSDMEKNEVLTIGGYIALGYAPENAPLVREHDILHNKQIDGTLTIKETIRLYELCDMGLFE